MFQTTNQIWSNLKPPWTYTLVPTVLFQLAPVFWGIFASTITYIWPCVSTGGQQSIPIKQSSAWTVTFRSQKQRCTMVQYNHEISWVFLRLLCLHSGLLLFFHDFSLSLKSHRDLSWALKVKPDRLSAALGWLRVPECLRRVHVPDLEDGWDSWRWLYVQCEAQCPSSVPAVDKMTINDLLRLACRAFSAWACCNWLLDAALQDLQGWGPSPWGHLENTWDPWEGLKNYDVDWPFRRLARHCKCEADCFTDVARTGSWNFKELSTHEWTAPAIETRFRPFNEEVELVARKLATDVIFGAGPPPAAAGYANDQMQPVQLPPVDLADLATLTRSLETLTDMTDSRELI